MKAESSQWHQGVLATSVNGCAWLLAVRQDIGVQILQGTWAVVVADGMAGDLYLTQPAALDVAAKSVLHNSGAAMEVEAWAAGNDGTSWAVAQHAHKTSVAVEPVDKTWEEAWAGEGMAEQPATHWRDPVVLDSQMLPRNSWNRAGGHGMPVVLGLQDFERGPVGCENLCHCSLPHRNPAAGM